MHDRRDYVYVLNHRWFESVHHDHCGFTLVAGTVLIVSSSMDELMRRSASALASIDDCEPTIPWRGPAMGVGGGDGGCPSSSEPLVLARIEK